MDKNQDVQPREKHEVAAPTEETRPGRVYLPAMDIFEDVNGLTLLADMPGVKAENLTIDLKEGVLTLRGEVSPPEGKGETDVIREYESGSFRRQFQLAESIDQDKISAQLRDGILRLQLPKVEKAKPRQIKIKTS